MDADMLLKLGSDGGGRLAYGTYRESLNAVGANTLPLPTWGTLPLSMQEAWVKVAEALCNPPSEISQGTSCYGCELCCPCCAEQCVPHAELSVR